MSTIISQRCIGYQRDDHGGLRAVIAAYWRDRSVWYRIEWTDEHGRQRVSISTRTRPSIDVDATPDLQQL